MRAWAWLLVTGVLEVTRQCQVKIVNTINGPDNYLDSSPAQVGGLKTRASNEGYPKVPEDFTIMEKAPTRAFFWLKAPTSAFTFKTLLRLSRREIGMQTQRS